jgi:peptide/nickel transport system substrate-binding protein
MTRRMATQTLALVMLAALAAAPGRAADLTIGRATEQSSLDPQFSELGGDSSTAENMFDSLIRYDSKLRVQPNLAVSWKALDPLTWEVKLRQGVKFHDGSDLSGEDVAFSLKRARNVPNSPGSLASYVRPITEIDVVDKYTVRIHTDVPTPLLINDMIGRNIFILPAKLGLQVTQDDFKSGHAMIGTGPYRFAKSLPADRVVMTANPSYWGGKPAFETVTLRFIPNPASRSAAVLSGDVDVIEQIPPSDVGMFRDRPGVTLFSAVSSRIVYLAMDQGRDDSPFITDKDGKPLKVNPLRDRRVRLALSKMINRPLIAQQLLAGAAEPDGQMVPEGMGGYDPSLKPMAFDLAGARKLLAEAGYPNGFGLTVHGSNNRFPSDAELAQTLGQMFSRGGLRVNDVVTLPYNVYAAQATQRKYSLFDFIWGGAVTSSQSGLAGVLATFDAAAGTGSLNRARYSNLQFDEILRRAASEFDEAKRNQLLAEATRVAMEDAAILPLYRQRLFWAARKGYVVDADRGESTTAHYISLQK